MTRAWRTSLAGVFSAAALLAAPQSAKAGTIIEPVLKVAVEERYDDDSLLQTESSLRIGGELMTKVTPEVGVSLKDRTFDIKGWYAPNFQARHLSGTFRVDHQAGIDFEKRLSRQHLVYGRAAIWRVADPTSLPRMGVGRTLSPVLYGTADAGLQAQLSERWGSAFRYRFEGTKIYEEGWPSGQVHAPTAELGYRLTERATLGAEYRFQYFLYGADHAVAHSPVATFRYRLSRLTVMNVKGGPVWFSQVAGEGAGGMAPRLHAEIARTARGWDLGFQAGQDVIGASGFSSALWAQYAGIYTSYRITEPVRVFAGGYGFRNGAAPGGVDDYLGRTDAAQNGYAVGGGVEWQINRQLALQGQVDRIAQVGVIGPDTDLSRNIAAVRLVVTPW